MNLLIDRAKWLRGEGGGTSFLLREADGKMCCLGFYGMACGVPADLLRNIKTPGASTTRWPDWLTRTYNSDGMFATVNSMDASTLMEQNDPATIPEPEREQRIAAIFAKHGVTVTFK